MFFVASCLLLSFAVVGCYHWLLSLVAVAVAVVVVVAVIVEVVVVVVVVAVVVVALVVLVAVVVSTYAGNKHTTLLSIRYVKYPLLIFKII